MTQTPILIVGYNRPLALMRRLSAIEKLSPRSIRIYLDGLKVYQQDSKILDVRNIADRWSTQSKHSVEIVFREKNIGIHDHLPKSLADFIHYNDRVIVIEDDIEFSEKFIQYIDTNLGVKSDTFAIQGFNPTFSPKRSLPDLTPPYFVNTRIPTIWGWGANANSINFFLEFRNTNSDLTKLNTVIRDFASWITKDRFLQNAITATWLSKMSRVLKQEGGSWDNWWVLASWASGKSCLMPSVDLSREESNQSEGQTHQHEKDPWGNGPLLVHELDLLEAPRAISKRFDRSLLPVWGINQKYAWVYSWRIKKQINSLLESKSSINSIQDHDPSRYR
jgi:hypothetical protein